MCRGPLDRHRSGAAGTAQGANFDRKLQRLGERCAAGRRPVVVVHAFELAHHRGCCDRLVGCLPLGAVFDPLWLSFPSRPTMRLVASELLAAITGSHSGLDRFKITRLLKAELAGAPRLVVVDEAQNLNRECIEFLRHLNEDPARRGAILLVGGERLLGGPLP